MARTRAGYALKRFAIEEYSIAELLDDPIAGRLMKSDGVDRQALEQLLLDQIAHSLEFGQGPGSSWWLGANLRQRGAD